MARLIDADALMEDTVWKCGGDPYDPYYMGYQDALDNVEVTIDAQDTVDAVEVVHSSWVLNDDGSGTCKHCHRITKSCWDYDNQMNYCANCGARMDLEVNDA